MRPIRLRYLAACTALVCFPSLSSAQSRDTPQTRMRPIGSPSAVDRYRRSNGGYRETVYQGRAKDSSARQTVMLQQSNPQAPRLPNNPPSGGMSMPNGNFNLPPNGNAQPNVSSGAPVNSVPVNPVPANPLPRAPLPGNAPAASVPSTSSSVLVPNAGDIAPIPQPQLGTNFATIDNCNCVSGPSSYSAASGIGCGVMPASYAGATPCGVAPYAAPPTYAPPSAQIAPQVVLPGATAPLGAPTTASAAPVPSLITLGQQTLPVEVGQGLWGQPVAYVPGQGFRNWIRYFFP